MGTVDRAAVAALAGLPSPRHRHRGRELGHGRPGVAAGDQPLVVLRRPLSPAGLDPRTVKVRRLRVRGQPVSASASDCSGSSGTVLVAVPGQHRGERPRRRAQLEPVARLHRAAGRALASTSSVEQAARPPRRSRRVVLHEQRRSARRGPTPRPRRRDAVGDRRHAVAGRLDDHQAPALLERRRRAAATSAPAARCLVARRRSR